MIRLIWFPIYLLIFLTAACQPADQGDGRIRNDEAQAAVMATGLTDVVIRGPAFRCAASGEPAAYTNSLKGPRQGYFFTARQGAGASYIGKHVRGMVCVRNNTTPSVKVFP
jgi:hypothetical protein